MNVMMTEPVRGNVLDAVLRPRGVAVVGASRDVTKRGYQVVRALLDGGFGGGIYPVNPAGGELCGLRVWHSVESIEGDPDLALVCTPAATVPAVIEACGRRGVAAAVVLAVGFGEAAADSTERALRDAIARSGVRVVGPNTSGVMNLTARLNLIGTRGVRAGRIALLVQSGNTALGAMTEAMATSAEGLSVVIGVGNETDLRYHDYLEWLGTDDATGCVLMYAEGFSDVRSFLETARRVVAHKPVVLLKGGRSDAGRAAARSHTGALAGEYTLLRAALRQIGVVEVGRSDELFPVGLTLLTQPAPRAGTGVAILSDGGGHGTLAADALTELETRLAVLSQPTRSRLRALLGPAAAVGNPIDLAGAADRAPGVFADALDILCTDDDVGGIIVVGLFGGYGIRFAPELVAGECAAAARMASAARAAGRSLVVHTLYATHDSEPLARLRVEGVPVAGSLEIACRCIAAAHERGAFLARAADAQDAATRPASQPVSDAVAAGASGARRFAGAGGARRVAAEADGADTAAAAFVTARAERREALLEPDVRTLVARFGVPVVDGAFCTDVDQVRAQAQTSDWPLVVKLVSPTISHKARAGCVKLGVLGADAAEAAYHEIVRSASAYANDRDIEPDVRGVLLTRMLARPHCELLVGLRRDADYGPLITLGAGGSGVELLRDTAVRMLPIDEHEIDRMLAQTHVGRALLGGWQPVVRALRGLVVDLAAAFMACDDLAELELNPVFVYDDGVADDVVVAVDARAFLRPASATI